MDSNTQFMNQLEEMGGGKSQAAPTGDAAKIQYTCHPIKNYYIGEYHFENSLLTLKNADEEARFLAVINDDRFPERERHMIHKLDTSSAERISREYRQSQGGATKQFDSSTGERADSSPKVGVGDLLGSHKKREELGLEAAAEGGREQKVPGAPDSNRETQTEPSPQSPPETPFRAESQGGGGAGSAADIIEELESDGDVADQAKVTLDNLASGKPADNEEAPAVESAKPHGFGKPLLAGTPK